MFKFRLLNSLYGKLAVVLCCIFLLGAVIFAFVLNITVNAYFGEVNQKLNRDLATNVISQFKVLKDGEATSDEIKSLFHVLMDVNPSIEAYLLDSKGNIVSFSPTKNEVIRQKISIEPIKSFLSGKIPVTAEDPRDLFLSKVFSAAPIKLSASTNIAANREDGFLYLVLAGQDARSTAQMVKGSYILNLFVLVTVLFLVGLLAISLILFNFVTGRLDRLVTVIREFNHSKFSSKSPRYTAYTRLRDEVDEVGLTFNEMADLISEQFSSLQKLDKFRKELTENISHDVRRPLSSLHGYLETLLLKEDALSPQDKKNYIERAFKNSQTCIRLISELFELSRLEAKEGPLNIEELSPVDLFADIVQEYLQLAKDKNLEIHTDFEAYLPMIAADIALIERVMNNLLDNAIQHTHAGGKVVVALGVSGQRLLVSVSDTGCGIPSSHLPLIFDRNYQTSRDTIDGTHAGLGLAISRKIIELHGSDLTVSSEVGTGSTFKFSLPIVNHL